MGRLMTDEGLSRRYAENARRIAEEYETDRCANRMIECYKETIERHDLLADEDPMPWDRFIEGIGVEWDLLSAKVSAAAAAVIVTPATEASLD